MKFKILRNVTLGIGCSMLALTLLSGVVKNYNVTSGLSGNTIHVDEDSPYGMVQSKHIIHIDQGSPYGMIQSNHGINIDMDSPLG
ncbi:hypothetical protein [Clostridium akagii]|uniref:hypothetical protein n=1 Tax=Clostridium akagii TaxID=91623 RepID=UPI00047C6226|nr:hypothetical protein [Clostridium akagii]